MNYYIGVDVGSGSVRAVLVDNVGKFKAKATQNIRIWNPKSDYYQQSSENIWQATCKVVKEVLRLSEIEADAVKGLSFAATCSLVVLDKNYQPLSINVTDEEPEQNIIMWMDHRALEEAEHVTRVGHPMLSQYGNTLSVESNVSKILWLKNNKSGEWWNSVGHFFDLPDFMTSKATGNYQSRSLCSLVCKLAYHSDVKGHQWDQSFWEKIGLKNSLNLNEANNKLGSRVLEPGQAIDGGLSSQAAEELGLKSGTKVAASLIDAYSGALALWGCRAGILDGTPLTSRLAMICGTSTCHMAISNDAHYHSGIWGPFYSVTLPGFWIREGGQSTAGKLIDHIVYSHPAAKSISQRLTNQKRTVIDELHSILEKLKEEKGLSSVCRLSEQLHVWPDFHGNRSPLANPTLKGTISGLTLGNSEEDLALLYLATVQALAYGTKLILEELQLQGPKIEVILMCGGLSQNYLYIQTHADVTGLSVVVPVEEDSVALGAAILGASCSKDFERLEQAMEAMGGQGRVTPPQPNDQGFHAAKYKVFKKLLSHQLEYQTIMENY